MFEFEKLFMHEVPPDDISNPIVQDAISLQTQYADYMYNELMLTDQKEEFYDHLKSFPPSIFCRPNGAFYVAYDSAKNPVGVIGYKKLSVENNNDCEMKRIFVNKAYRGCGYGSVLVRFLIQQAKLAGFKSMYLDTDANMKNAINLYKTLGFSLIESYRENINDCPVFMKIDF